MRPRRLAQGYARRRTRAQAAIRKTRKEFCAALTTLLRARQIIEHDRPDDRFGACGKVRNFKPLDRSGRLAEIHETAVRAQATQRAAPGILADGIENRVAQCAAREFRYTFCEILAAVLDHSVIAMSTGQLGLFRRTRGSDRARPQSRNPLTEQQSHATGGGMNQNCLPVRSR